MTTDPLANLTTAAVQRARINCLLWYVTAGLLAGLLYATGFVLAERYYPQLSTSSLNTTWVPALLVLSSALLGWIRFHETPIHVAARLDEHAHTSGALSTWNALQSIPPATPMEQAFREAQRLDALKRLKSLKLSQHMPVRLPEWSAYGWLALLALCCAWLLPPREDTEFTKPNAMMVTLAPNGGAGTAPNGPEKAQPLASTAKPEQLEISLLTPTDLLKADVMMQNPQTPLSLKEDFLRELEAKMGALPLENMNPKERELLQQLRRQTNAAQAQEHPVETTGTGTDTGSKPKPTETQLTTPGLNALPKTDAERRAVFQERFPDVQNALEKYYKTVK